MLSTKLKNIFKNVLLQKKSLSAVKGWAEENGYVTKLKLEQNVFDALLAKIVSGESISNDLLKSDPIKTELDTVIEKYAGDNNLNPEKINDISNLLSKGNLLEDVFYSVRVILSSSNKPDCFFSIDLNSEQEDSLLSGLSSDDFDLIKSDIKNDIERIKKGEKPKNYSASNAIFKSLYSNTSVGELVGTANSLLAPENESVRLALKIYARLNGININSEDIDVVRESILNKKKPNLGLLYDYLSNPENIKRLVVN